MTSEPKIEPLAINLVTAAKILGLSRSSLYSLLSQGRIGPPVIRINGRCLMSLADLREWVAMRNLETGELPSREKWIEMQKEQKK